MKTQTFVFISDTAFGEFFTDRPSIHILYYPGERDD